MDHRAVRKLLAVAALVALVAGVFWLRSSSRTSAPPDATAAAPAPPAPAREPDLDPLGGSSFASAQLDAKERSELETIDRVSDELGLSADERQAARAALAKLQAGRRAEFAKLVDYGEDEKALTAALLAHHRAFDEDIGKALGEPRASELRDRYNDAYGLVPKEKAKDEGAP